MLWTSSCSPAPMISQHKNKMETPYHVLWVLHLWVLWVLPLHSCLQMLSHLSIIVSVTLSLVFLQHLSLVLASWPLHLLFSLPGKLCLQIFANLNISAHHSGLCSCHFTEAFPIDSIQNCITMPLPALFFFLASRLLGKYILFGYIVIAYLPSKM